MTTPGDTTGLPHDDVPDLGPVPTRIDVDADTVGRLVAAQHPRWAGLPVRPVRDGGWDNHTFHLGDDLIVRLPSAAEYALAVEKEQRWLPALAAHLTVPVPEVAGRGEPGEGYPHPWSVYRWLDDEPATTATVDDPVALAADLAGFLVELRAVDPTGGPRPGIHNWFRGGTLRTFDTTVQDCLDDLRGRVDAAAVTDVWAEALAARWDGADTWFHGDLAPGNLLLRDGRLAAVIDFGTCGVGDPACDLAVGWTLLDDEARALFRRRLGVDDAQWARGRGWALWKTLASLAGTMDDPQAAGAAARHARVLDAVLSPAGEASSAQ